MEFVRKKFPFTRTLNHLIESCPVEDKLALIEAFIAYGLDGIENELHGRAFELFLQAKIDLDKSWKLYRNGAPNQRLIIVAVLLRIIAMQQNQHQVNTKTIPTVFLLYLLILQIIILI